MSSSVRTRARQRIRFHPIRNKPIRIQQGATA
jgi:hypothetical protein